MGNIASKYSADAIFTQIADTLRWPADYNHWVALKNLIADHACQGQIAAYWDIKDDDTIYIAVVVNSCFPMLPIKWPHFTIWYQGRGDLYSIVDVLHTFNHMFDKEVIKLEFDVVSDRPWTMYFVPTGSLSDILNRFRAMLQPFGAETKEGYDGSYFHMSMQ